MFAPFVAFAVVALIGLGLPVATDAASPAPAVTPVSSKGSNGTALGRKINLHPGSANRKVSAAACQSRAATMPGSAGTLGPNGPSDSQTVITVPVSGTSVASTAEATQRAQLADACARLRH